MIRAAIAVPVAFCAWPADARFAPPVDTSLRLTIVQSREGGGAKRRFVAERTVVFHKAASGFTADVTLDATLVEGDPVAGHMFEAGLAGLLHRTIRFRLDDKGALVAVDDLNTVWAAWTGGIAAMTPAVPNPRSPAAQPDALPPVRKQAMLGSIIASLIAPDLPLGERDLQVRTQAAAGAGAPLRGRERVARAADGLINATGNASGAVQIAGASATVTVESTRRYDPATGLIHETSERTVTRVGDVASIVATTASLTVR